MIASISVVTFKPFGADAVAIMFAKEGVDIELKAIEKVVVGSDCERVRFAGATVTAGLSLERVTKVGVTAGQYSVTAPTGTPEYWPG